MLNKNCIILNDYDPKRWSGGHLTSSELSVSRIIPAWVAVHKIIWMSAAESATVKIPAVCLTSLRGGAELQAESEAEPEKKR